MLRIPAESAASRVFERTLLVLLGIGTVAGLATALVQTAAFQDWLHRLVAGLS
jgi:hypothetical protein